MAEVVATGAGAGAAGAARRVLKCKRCYVHGLWVRVKGHLLCPYKYCMCDAGCAKLQILKEKKLRIAMEVARASAGCTLPQAIINAGKFSRSREGARWLYRLA